MVTTAIETYLGWEQPEHLAGCKRPMWAVDFRTDPEEFRYRYNGGDSQPHSCPNEDCGHGDRYPRTTVRIVCPSCQAAIVIRGEDAHTSRGMTANTTHGFGLPPRKVAGLLLWPGEPFLSFGRLSSDEPYDFVVTRLGVKRVTETDVVGQISQSRGKRNAVTWTAAALPAPNGRYGYGRIRWSQVSGEASPLRTVMGAARWVAARLAERATAGGDA